MNTINEIKSYLNIHQDNQYIEFIDSSLEDEGYPQLNPIFCLDGEHEPIFCVGSFSTDIKFDKKIFAFVHDDEAQLYSTDIDTCLFRYLITSLNYRMDDQEKLNNALNKIKFWSSKIKEANLKEILNKLSTKKPKEYTYRIYSKSYSAIGLITIEEREQLIEEVLGRDFLETYIERED